MSYVDEVYENVVAKNPNEPEFHQAVKEVLDSLKVVIDKNEEKYRSTHKSVQNIFHYRDHTACDQLRLSSLLDLHRIF